MFETLHMWLPDAKATASAGASLAHTLHTRPLTILLRGDLGAGKTTFLQGLGLGLGIEQRLLSPTYALEQRYEARDPLLHLDLYRLTPRDADALVESSADFPGIRCIEWSERLTHLPEGLHMVITLDEDGTGRSLDIVFNDVPLPSPSQIEEWRRMVALPTHIAGHCDAVAMCAVRLADDLRHRGVIVRREMLHAAARVHDLFRFVDFRPEAMPPGIVYADEQKKTHAEWTARYLGLRHEAACAAFLRENGYGALAEVVAVHGLMLPSPPRLLIEQQILFYADKRVNGATVVSLRERFDDFRVRYSNGAETEQAKKWLEEAVEMEKKLFPDGKIL